MITIFLQKNLRFLKKQCYDQFFAKFSFVLSKNATFCRFFWWKCLKNHNIGYCIFLAYLSFRDHCDFCWLEKRKWTNLINSRNFFYSAQKVPTTRRTVLATLDGMQFRGKRVCAKIVAVCRGVWWEEKVLPLKDGKTFPILYRDNKMLKYQIPANELCIHKGIGIQSYDR
jgi:hypothetical protein